MSTLLKFVSGDINTVRPRVLEKLISDLPNLRVNKTETVHNCYVFLLSPDKIGVSLAASRKRQASVRVGEELHWIGKWMIELSPLPEKTLSSEEFFVRPFNYKRDAILLRRGVRVIRRTKLPHCRTWASLPVVTDQEQHVVAIPHFKYNNRTYGIEALVRYCPLISLDYAYKCNSNPLSNC